MKGFENKQKKRWEKQQRRQDLESKRKQQLVLNALPVRNVEEASTLPECTVSSEEFIKMFGTTSFEEGDMVIITGTTNTTRIIITR